MTKIKSTHPTRADVARVAGVAPPTVSLVLNNHPKIRVLPATRKRIMQAARDLNYQPSGLARALVTGNTNAVGVVLYHLQNPFGSYTAGILSGFWKSIRDTGMRLITDQPSENKGAAGMFRERIVEGVIVIAPGVEADAEICQSRENDFPLIQVGSRFLGLNADYVDLDNVAAQKVAVQELLSLGHKKILYLSGPAGISSALDRKQGFKEALADAGISVKNKLILQGTYLFKSGLELTRQVMGAGIEFTAIAAANDSMALGAIQALRESGITVPRQVSVIGINGFYDENTSNILLATIVQPLEEIGCLVAKLLLERIRNKRSKVSIELIPGSLRKGETLAPPPEN